MFLSIADHGLMSAFNLALNLAFIAWATPEVFGNFALILAGGFFAVSAQNALVVMPLNYLLPGRDDDEVRARLAMLSTVNAVLVALLSLASPLLGLLVGADTALTACIAAFLLTMLLREYVRNVAVVAGRMGRALAGDAAAVAVSAALVPLFWQMLRPEAAALAGLAAGNLAVLCLRARELCFEPLRLREHLLAYRAIWADTRWALQGALQNEVDARLHLFVVERWRDAAAVGTLQAGRVAVSPLLLVVGAWRRVARPKLVQSLHRGRPRQAARLIWSGALLVAASTLVYGVLLAAAWPLLEARIFRGRYPDMHWIVLFWWLYAGIVGLAGVAATLLQARRRFRELAVVGYAVSATIVALLAGLFFSGLPLVAAIAILAGVHLVELAFYCAILRRELFERPAAPRLLEGRP